MSVHDEAGRAFSELCALMEKLRAPDGCDWDRAQDVHTLRPYLLEETHEVLDVLDRLGPDGSGPHDEHKKELGDLLLQIVFQSEIQREAGRFNAGDVAAAIYDKLVRRHPHLFDPDFEGDARPDWESIKKAERDEAGASTASALDGVPTHLPALLRAYRVGEKAHRVGFDWPDAKGVLDKIEEELGEVKETLDIDDLRPSNKVRFEEEAGDLMYAVVNLCRHFEVDPEAALRKTIKKFEHRFRHVEALLHADGKNPFDADLDELEGLWNQAKRSIAAGNKSSTQSGD